MNVNDEIVISGKIIGIDPITKNCWIGLKNVNSPSSETHDLTIAVPHQYIQKKSQFITNNDNETNIIKESQFDENELKENDDNDIDDICIKNINSKSVSELWDNMNSWNNNTDNDDVSRMINESSMKCDAWFLKECPQTKRILFILQYYQKWIEYKENRKNNLYNKNVHDSMTSFISSLSNYSYNQILNDFHHLRNYHININELDKTDDVYKYFKKNCKCNAVNDNICRSFKRNTRNREKCRNKTYRDQLYFIADNDNNKNNLNHIQEINVQNILDTIHSSLNHYDIKNMTLSNKFITSFNQKKTNKYDNNVEEKTNDQQYGFGVEFSYGPNLSSYPDHCPMKYSSLKEEFLRNNAYKLDAFEIESLYKAATNFVNTNQGRKLKAKPGGVWNKLYGIEVGTQISVQHIMVLMSYSNFDNLQNKYKKTYRKINEYETRKQITKRHQEIANWAYLIQQCFFFYSERLTNGDITFYHGINMQLKFDKFETMFYCPTSTTTVRQIAFNFASNNGIILEISKAGTKGPRYLNMTYLSDYPKEEERLTCFASWSFTNIIYNGISTKHHIKCLKLFEKITKGSFVVNNKELFQIKYEKTLIKMIENFMNMKGNKNKMIYDDIPSYLQLLFNHYSSKIKTFWINDNEFNNLLPELQLYLKQQSSLYFGIKAKPTFGIFTSFLNRNYNQISFATPTILTWSITGSQLKSFWNGNKINGQDIKCNINHIINDNKSFITFYPLCSKNTRNTNDERFEFGIKAKPMSNKIRSYSYEYEVDIKEIDFKLNDKCENIGCCYSDLFSSSLLKNMKSFTMCCLIRVVSCAM